MNDPKTTDLRTVGDLKSALAEFSDDIPLGAQVYSSSWFAPTNRHTHGPLELTPTRLHYAGGETQDIILIHAGEIRTQFDGYGPTPLRRTYRDR